MTLKELSSVFYLQKEIDLITAKISELETQAEKITPSLTGTPPSSGISDKVGEAGANISDYHRKLEILKAQLMAEKSRIINYIYTIPDSQTRIIFICKYIDLKTWTQVAEKLGGNNTADGVKIKAYRYVNTHF